MLEDNKAITIVRCNASAYTCYPMRRCSWFDKHIAKLGDSGIVFASEIHVRIPSARLVEMPQVGDIVVLGRVTSVSAPSDLDAYRHAKVMHVADNRRGNLSHVAVIAN